MKAIIFTLSIALFLSCKQKKEPAELKPVQTTFTKVNDSSAESIYVLEDTFTNENNSTFVLSQLKGKPTVVAMIFTNCVYACPRITSDMLELQKKLSKDSDKINFLLVSFDTERDTPAALKAYANNMNLDKNWTLLHGSDEAVRILSVLLNIQFAKDESGNFSHSNIISVLDKNGVLKFQKEGLNVSQEKTFEAIKKEI